MKRINIKKILRILLFTFVFMLLLGIVLPIVFEDKITNEVKKAINDSITTKLDFESSQISLLKNFPTLTITFQNIDLSGAKPFEEKPLMKAGELGFGIHIMKLVFKQEVYITKTFLKDAQVYLVKDKKEHTNYDILKETDSFEKPQQSNDNQFNINFKRLKIKNSSFIYRDESTGITIYSKGLKFKAETELEKGKLALVSKMTVDSLDITYDKINYLKGKKIIGTSNIVYDTNNLSIGFDQNTLTLNDLDLRFDGDFNLFEKGFAYKAIFDCENAALTDVISALPPQYLKWVDEMRKMNGRVNAKLKIQGFSGIVPESHQNDHLALDMELKDATLAHKESDDLLEDLNVNLSAGITKNTIDLNLDEFRFSINDQNSSGTLKLKGSPDNFFIKSSVQSKLNLTTLNNTLRLPDVTFAGHLNSNWNIEGIYQPELSKFPTANGKFELNKGYVKLASYPEPIQAIMLKGNISNTGNDFSTAQLNLDAFDFEFKQNPFKAQVFMKDFNDPEYAISCKGTVDFTSLQDMIDIPLLLNTGQMKADFTMAGKLHSTASIPEHKGSLLLKNVSIKPTALERPIQIQNGDFLFLNQKMAFRDFQLTYANTDIILNGYFENYLDFLLYNKGILKGSVQLNAQRLSIADFLPKQKALQPKVQPLKVLPNQAVEINTGVLQVPDYFDVSLEVAIDTVQYNALEINDLKGLMAVKEQTLFLKNSELKMVDGKAKLDGFYKPIDLNNAMFSMDLKADHLNIKKGFNTIVLFQELMPAAEKAAGFISVDYNLSGVLNQNMLPEMSSLKGKGSVAVDSIQFDNYKLFSSLSRKSGFNALDDPKISEIKIYSKIDHNVLEIERFKYRVKHIRLRTEGQISLDGDLGLKMRIGIPPFGLIGIPVVVKGTHEDFNIKLGKRTPDLKSVDTINGAFSKEDLFRIKMLRDSIKPDMTIKEIDAMQERIQNMSMDSLMLKPTDSISLPD